LLNHLPKHRRSGKKHRHSGKDVEIQSVFHRAFPDTCPVDHLKVVEILTLIDQSWKGRQMSNSVLIAIDGSPGSDRALQYAKDRAKLGGAKLIVAYVIEWSPYSFNTPEENAERHMRREQEIERATSGVVAPAAALLQAEGIECETVVQHGPPAETLIRLAEQNDVKQIVIGRRGQSGIKTLLFGSVAGNLIQTSPVPVVVVP
jgi:nucleotide-binding universal stress UspA family protein